MKTPPLPKPPPPRKGSNTRMVFLPLYIFSIVVIISAVFYVAWFKWQEKPTYPTHSADSITVVFDRDWKDYPMLYHNPHNHIIDTVVVVEREGTWRFWQHRQEAIRYADIRIVPGEWTHIDIQLNDGYCVLFWNGLEAIPEPYKWELWDFMSDTHSIRQWKLENIDLSTFMGGNNTDYLNN